ncbi:MAG: hypothetical protein GY786_13100, partial [Proteobacteria bacterium]|nr:hypothetical protein [Pseudomonadota bacterium]
METTVANLNKTPIQEYGNLFDQISGMIVFDKHQFLDIGQGWKQELQDLLEKDFRSEGAKRCLDLENKRQVQFEKVLDPLDDALNLSFDDWRKKLDKFGLEYWDV